MCNKRESARHAVRLGCPRADPLDVFNEICIKKQTFNLNNSNKSTEEMAQKTRHTVGESKNRSNEKDETHDTCKTKKTLTPWGLACKQERFLHEIWSSWGHLGDPKSPPKTVCAVGVGERKTNQKRINYWTDFGPNLEAQGAKNQT